MSNLWTPAPAVTRSQVIIAQPLYDRVPARAHGALVRMAARTAEEGYLYNYIETTNSYIHYGRNALVKAALEQAADGATHLLFVDQDVAMPSDAVSRLLAHQKPVVGGLYYLKDPNPNTRSACAFEGFGDTYRFIEPVPGLQQVGGIGMGCTLIDLDVFRRIEATFTQQNIDSANLWFALVSGGEDVWFSLRCKALDIPIYLDADLVCEHIGDYSYMAPDGPRPSSTRIAVQPACEGELRE